MAFCSLKHGAELENKTNMKTKMVWRFAKLPSVDELSMLIERSVITKDEARQILFSSETEEERDKQGLESEIKFLRDLVEKLSNDKAKVVEVIRTIERPYIQSPWYRPYATWCAGTTYTAYLPSATGSSNFTNIKTF